MRSNKLPDQDQTDLFAPRLKEMLNPKNELFQLAEKINWDDIEQEFSGLYSNKGRPAHPIRLMVSLLILKQLYNLGDESLPGVWIQNPYYQYFLGFGVFQWKFPVAPSDLVHFRKRIGTQGAEFILKASLAIQDQRKLKCEEISIDTTVQPKNITYPTDGKLRIKVIEKCVGLAHSTGVGLRRSFKKEVTSLLLKLHNGSHPKRKKNAGKALKRLKTIANTLLRELRRKLTADQLSLHGQQFELWSKAINQAKNDKGKVYSLHEPDVACIAKGKAHPKYEFGSKVSMAISQNTNLILSAVSFTGNPHDSKTVEETLQAMKRVTDKQPKRAYADRAYSGANKVLETQVIIPSNGKGKSDYEKRKARKKMRRRAAIEPIFSHTKHQYRMVKNYLKGIKGDEINAILAASAFNFKSWMNQIQLLAQVLIRLIEKYSSTNARRYYASV